MSKTAQTNRRNRDRGKQHEREIAKRLGGKRRGLFGEEDVEAGPFSIECKSKKALPSYLREYYAQAERHANGRIPVVALHEMNRPYDHDFIMIRLDVWMSRILPLLEGGESSMNGQADLQEVYERLGELLAGD
jgi:hypothetical protein